MKKLIVTAADEGYAELLFDLIASLLPHKEILNFDIACLDIGLSDDARLRLATLPVHLHKPTWPFRPHAVFDKNTKYLARAARPFLPDYFPGYETYTWIDADAWIQQPDALQWLSSAARYADIAGAPTIHRTYTFRTEDISWLAKRYEMAFGGELARQLMQHAYLNSGVFAASHRTTLWKKFATRFQVALDRWEGEFLSDQAVLNATMILDDLRFERLPAQVNWICHLSLPVWDPKRQLLCVPAMPFEAIKIVHNTFTSKQHVHKIRTLDNKLRESKLSFSGLKALHNSNERLSA